VELVSKNENSTCGIIKPHAVKSGDAGKIIREIVAHGFEITGAVMTTLDLTAAEEFFEVYRYVVSDYNDMAKQLASGPCLALEFSKDGNAVSDFREVCGPRDPTVAKQIRPRSIRGLFGVDLVQNAIHCTDLEEDAPLETEYFFALLD
jgi:nucleoside-diphosphate kinase